METTLRNNGKLLLVNTQSKIANCSPYFITLQVINNIELEGSYEMTVNLDNLQFLKIFIERFQNYLLIC